MIRVGIAGIGFMGMIHYLAYQKLRGVKVAALCEQDAKRLAGDWRTIKGNFGPQGQMMDLAGIARYADLDDMMADPSLDVIDICLPPAWHAKRPSAALKAGKHVFCEKPIASNPADATRMVQAAKQAGKLLMIGHVLPFFPEYHFAYEAINSGKYGRATGRAFQADHLRSHLASRLLRSAKGRRADARSARPRRPFHPPGVRDAQGGADASARCAGEVVERFSTQFLYDPPRMVTAASGVIDQQGRPFTHAYEIYLEKATLFFDYMAVPKVGDAVTPLTVLLNDGKVLRPKLGPGDPSDAFVAELGEVVRAVRSNTTSPLLAGELARDAVVLCQKQTESIVRGRAVKV